MGLNQSNQASSNARFGGHMPITTNEVITHHIKVNDTQLYYQPYAGQTISDLATQY